MNILIISGSHRPTGNSGRVADHIASHLSSQGHKAEVMKMSEVDLPYWDEAFWGEKSLQPKWDKLWQPWADKLMAADAAVIIAGEYHGMVPSRLQNLLLLLAESGKPLAHKPVMLVGVSKSVNGAYPIAQLRSYAGKNTRLLPIPEHIIVRNADGMLTEAPKPENAKFDAELRTRITDTLEILIEYAKALAPVQKIAREFLKKYPNGM